MEENAPSVIKIVAGVVGLATLGFAIIQMLRQVRQPAGRETGAAQSLLRLPMLLVSTAVFFIFGYLLWRPIPIYLSLPVQALCLICGFVVYSTGIGLYLWGMHALGKWFGPSSGFGVRLQVGHQLVRSGPYRYLRHPMYLGVILAGLGGVLIFWTWSMALFAIGMLGLTVRAHQEDKALEQEFGEEWIAYARQVPAWLPKIARH